MKLKIFSIFLIFAFWAIPPSTLYAQGELLKILKVGQEEKKVELPLIEVVQQAQTQTQEELAALEKSLRSLEIDPDSSQSLQLRQQQSLLKELNLYYEQILEAIQRGQVLAKEKTEIQENLNVWSQEDTPEIIDPNFDLLDDFSDSLQLDVNRIEVAESTIQTLKASLQEAKEEHLALEKERRRVKEEVETEKDPTIRSDLQHNLKILQLESRIAKAKVTLIGLELKNEQLLKTNNELERDLFQRKISWLKKKVEFGEDELEVEIGRIDEEKKQITRELDKARKEFQNFESRIAGREEGFTSTDMEFIRSERRAYQSRISVLAQRYQRLDEIEETWRRRYLAYNELADKSQLTEWQLEAEQAVDQVRRQETLINIRLSEIRKNLSEIQERIVALEDSDPNLTARLKSERDQLTKLINADQDYLSSLSRESQLYRKFRDEISAKVEGFNLWERVSLAFGKVNKVWNFEITSIDDKPITVKKLVIVLILLLLGYRFSRRFSRWLGSSILPRLGMESGVAAGLQTLAFYLLVTIVTIIVLYIVNVPLTLFTVLGGALAIGVGFGSQKIVGNFISGLILLMEQPIKIGDMVEIDQTYGTIERIGARSTRIRKFNNVHVIVPNSDLLEKNVINWTLSDDLIRVMVNVGVAYGSPTRDVAKLIRKSVDEHGKVIPNPEPIVIFKEFGDNALIFEVHFWIKMRTLMDREKVESDIRFRIDSLFREAGITIAFPQRDVHMDTLKPLEVQLVTPKSEIEVSTGPEDLKEKLKEKHGDKLKEKSK